MALQGTIETFALPEVLRMLGAGAKTGRLQVTGDRGSGRVWIADGEVVGAEASGTGDGAAAVSVIFELLRYAEGSFTFDDQESDETASIPSPGEPQDVEALLADAEARLGEWHDIEAVVPALSVGLTFTDELPTDEVTVDATRWRALGAVADGRSVAAIAAALDLDELDACRCAKELVEAGLVVVTEAPAEPVGGPATVEVSGALAAAVDEQPTPTAGELAAWAVTEAGSTATAPYAEPIEPEPAVVVDGGYAPEPAATAESTFGYAEPASTDPAAPEQPYAEPPYAEQPYSESYATSGFGDPYAEQVGADPGYANSGFESSNGATASTARAELDAMASGFGLQDAVPETNGFEHGFASDPSEDPAFSFAAPDAVEEPDGGFGLGSGSAMGFDDGSYDGTGFEAGAFEGGFEGAFAAPTPTSPSALFAGDVAGAPSPGVGGDQLFASGSSAFETDQDDAGDAAEVARQLANLSPKAARAVAAAARATTAEEREAALAEVTSEGDEPINRGLLLKFLSSVQS